MTIFLRLLADDNKSSALNEACTAIRSCNSDSRVYEVSPETFRALPGTSFAYWVCDSARSIFRTLPPFESAGRTARQGLATADDFRFLRLAWEVCNGTLYVPFAKGGTYSPFYSDVYLVVKWSQCGRELSSFDGSVIRNPDYYSRPGLTWPRRTKSRLSMRVLPAGCIFGDKGPAVFVERDDRSELLSILALTTTSAFHNLIEVQLAAADARPGGAAHSFEVGVIQKTPQPNFTAEQRASLAAKARRAWSLKRSLDSVNETSHAFLIPATLRARRGLHDTSAVDANLARIQGEIDDIAFGLYGFADADRAAITQPVTVEVVDSVQGDDEDEDANDNAPANGQLAFLCWAVGVTFGRFDWRLVTGERPVPPEPDPFDPLPTRSPGMLPDGAELFHAYAGILVDDQGHVHDLAHLVEEVLARVEEPVPEDVRRWLQRDFFAFHLQRYSKSRRKAPIYWPLATASGSYTLWIYYPSLTSQTLYTAVNDFIEPKFKQVDADLTALRSKGAARTRDDEKRFEALQAFEVELIELRDTLLKLAPSYKPNHDDGVQISAAPLWPLFRHKPWQKVLKETWAKLEKGDYDWSHLAMSYWPVRVRAKCKTDKSLAIAHGLEDLYVKPETAPRKRRARIEAEDEA